MSEVLVDADAWMVVAVLAVAMMAAWAAAWWRGRSVYPEKDNQPANKFNDAILALLGLLLAFTFSMSLSRHEQRRQMVLMDSNSIGDFSTCVSLLDEPARETLQAAVRRYVEHRLSLGRTAVDEAALQRGLDETRAMHLEMQSQVKKAIDGGTRVVVPLTNTLNELTSAHASRLSAVRDRLPPSVVLLLIFSAVVSMLMMGWQQGVAHEWHPRAAIAFTTLVCMVLWVTLDLNQPQFGWITVSQEPLQELLRGMKN